MEMPDHTMWTTSVWPATHPEQARGARCLITCRGSLASMSREHLTVRSKVTIAVVLMLLAKTALAAANHEPCSEASSVSDVLFSLALKDHGAVFQYGEIIPVVLSFTSKTANRYWADVRNHDRSEGLEHYCAEPEAPDPLERTGAFLGGGPGTTHPLDATPLTVEAELNEWRTFQPGHYRVYAVSNRVWRPAGAGEQTTYPRVSEVVRSNAIEIEVSPLDPAWQSEQLRSAVQTLAGPSSPEDAHRAARILRFLNTRDSAKQLARLFWGLNRQPNGYDLMYGLYGSPYRQLVIDSMRAELAVPDHAITSDFLSALVDLQVTADPSWAPPSTDPVHPEEGQAFWERRQAHARELMAAEIQTVTAALSRKTGSARALTLDGLLRDAGGDQKLG